MAGDRHAWTADYLFVGGDPLRVFDPWTTLQTWTQQFTATD